MYLRRFGCAACAEIALERIPGKCTWKEINHCARPDWLEVLIGVV